MAQQHPSVVAVVVAALAAVLVGCSVGASAVSPTPTAVPGTSPTQGTGPLQPTPVPTTVPTPAPTVPPAVSAWTSLQWADPFDPFPVQLPSGTTKRAISTALMDVVVAAGYVGVGSRSDGFQCRDAVFARSDDGLHWAVTHAFSSGDERISTMCPSHVVQAAGGLLAMGEKRIWSSTDGSRWTEIDSPTWRALWTTDMPQLVAVASGPGGVVVIGTQPGTDTSIVAHSMDGHAWQPVALPAAEVPIARAVAVLRGGFVIVGRDGQPDRDASPTHMGLEPGVGRPAAWISTDGATWVAAHVEGSRVEGGGLTRVLVGARGLFAIGIDTSADFYPDGDYSQGRTVAAWSSTNGTTWSAAGALGRDLPPMGDLLASDGVHMVAFGLRQPWVGQPPTAWTSIDGRHWSALTLSGKAPDVNLLALEPMLLGDPPGSAIWVVGGRLLVLGGGDGVPTDEPYANQWFRFGTVLPAGD